LLRVHLILRRNFAGLRRRRHRDHLPEYANRFPIGTHSLDDVNAAPTGTAVRGTPSHCKNLAMIVSVFVRRLKPGHTFEDFIREWEADVGFGVPTRVFNGASLDDPGTVVSIGFVGTTPDEVRAWLAAGAPSEKVRHGRIETVVESTELRAMFEVRTEHDFTAEPVAVEVGSVDSLLAALERRP